MAPLGLKCSLPVAFWDKEGNCLGTQVIEFEVYHPYSVTVQAVIRQIVEGLQAEIEKGRVVPILPSSDT